MLTANVKTNRNTISQRVREVRAAWSRNERRQRAVDASQRIHAFLSLIGLPHPEPEVWAVGAPVFADLKRISR